MAHLGYLGISWDSLRLQLSHCDPPQPRDRRGGRHIFAKSRFCGLAKPEATATLHTTHRPGAQSDVFWRSSEIPMIYWYTFKIPSKYLQKSSKSNIIQYPTFSDTPKWSKGDWLQDFDGSGLDRLTSGLVLLVRSPSGFYEWARKPSESHIAKAKTKEAARRASTSQLFSFDVFGSLCQGLPSSFVDLWCWGWRLVCCEPDPEDLPGSSQRLLQEALGSRLRQSASGHLSNCWERDIMRFAEFFFLVPVFFVTMIDVCFGCLICTRWSPRSHTTQRATAGWGLYPLHRPQGREVLEKVLVGAISDLWFQTCFKAFEILDDLDSQFGMITWEISSNYS